MSGRSLRLVLIAPLLAGCALSEPEEDWGLEFCNGSDRTFFVRLGYRDPDAGRVERMFPLGAHTRITLAVKNETWAALARRVGSFTIDFCDHEQRETLEQIVVTESELRSADWTILYPKP